MTECGYFHLENSIVKRSGINKNDLKHTLFSIIPIPKQKYRENYGPRLMLRNGFSQDALRGKGF